MNRIDVDSVEGFFEVVGGTDRSQAASMTLGPGQTTGGPTNFHAESDQWLFVTDGEGVAIVEDETIEIGTGDLLLIEAGEIHEIRNPGEEPLRTVNVYAPPEY